MHSRHLHPIPLAPWTYPNLVLRTSPNWTAVGFLTALAALHLTVGGRAFAAGRWEGYVGLGFGSIFAVAALITFNIRREIAVLYHHGKIRLRTGVGRWSAERMIPFCCVHAVRVTLGVSGSGRDSYVELSCLHEDIPCPPTAVPRQLGLLLAMMTGAPLVKVLTDAHPEPAATAPEAERARAIQPGESATG